MRLFAGIMQTSEILSNLSYCFHTGEVAGSIGHRPLTVLRPISERLLDIAKDPGYWDIDRATNVPEYLGTQPSSPG